MKKRPFYKAIEGYWDRFFILLMIILVSVFLHFSSLWLVIPVGTSVRPAAEETVTETGTALVNLSINQGRFNIRDTLTNDLVVRDQVGSGSFKLAPGNYKIEFLPVPGFKPPDASSFSLAPKQTNVINCKFLPVNK